MITKPSQEEVQAEIASLKELRDQVRHHNYFGDDNRAAIDAQIEVLEKDYDDDDVYNNFDVEFIIENAQEAVSWLNGEREEGTLSEEWRPLAQ